jgi:hypothetical protein
MEENQIRRLINIAKLTKADVGNSEENVKQKIVVPLLEVLGHDRNDLDFEFSSKQRRIDIFIKGLPPDCKVIIDTKAYDEILEDHIEQIKRYAEDENPLLTMIINGEELRTYSLIPGCSFKESLIYCLKREELTIEESQNALEKYFGRKHLLNREVRNYVRSRQEEIINLRLSCERIIGQYDQLQTEIKNQIEDERKKIEELQKNISSLQDKLNNLEPSKLRELELLYEEIGLPFLSDKPDLTSGLDEEEIESSDDLSQGQATFLDNGKTIEITLSAPRQPKTEPTWKKYKLIYVYTRVRGFFPGFKVPFSLETDVGTITTHIAAGRKNVSIGDPNAGWYFSKSLRQWYNRHSELKVGDILIIAKLGEKRYKLDIKR